MECDLFPAGLLEWGKHIPQKGGHVDYQRLLGRSGVSTNMEVDTKQSSPQGDSVLNQAPRTSQNPHMGRR